MADLYEVAIEKLKTDARPLAELSRLMAVPKETLRDIKSGHIKSPRLDTARKIAALYALERQAIA